MKCDAMWIYPRWAKTGANCTCVYEPAVSSLQTTKANLLQEALNT